jgi:hypothetical protein
MSFRVLGDIRREVLRAEIFGGDTVATRSASTKAALNGAPKKHYILYMLSLVAGARNHLNLLFDAPRLEAQ